MSAADWTTIDQPQDIRLVVADMDGTLLDEHGRIPEGFWDMLARLRARGVEFVPASGRQYATLRNMFASKASEVLDGGELSYIAENGNVVAVDGKVVEVHGVDLGITRRTIDMVNASVSAGEYDMGLVICGLNTAYVQRTDTPFLDEVGKYYAPGEEIILKLAILDFGSSEQMTNNKLAHVRNDYQVVVSGQHWVDIMNPATDKKQGVEALQRALGVTPAQTAVFGDYLNVQWPSGSAGGRTLSCAVERQSWCAQGC